MLVHIPLLCSRRSFSTVKRSVRAVASLILTCGLGYSNVAAAQTGPAAAAQAPKTAPATAQILASYEGQNVTSVEIAGRPEANTAQFAPQIKQESGQPFVKAKVDATVDAIRATGKFKEVQLQVEPEANGVRVLLVLEPAVWFGIFEFPGAERFAYSRLVQTANFPPQAPFNPGDVEKRSAEFAQLFQAGRFLPGRGHAGGQG